MITRRQRKYREIGRICCAGLAGNVITGVVRWLSGDGLNAGGVIFAVVMILGASFCFWKGYRSE